MSVYERTSSMYLVLLLILSSKKWLTVVAIMYLRCCCLTLLERSRRTQRAEHQYVPRMQAFVLHGVSNDVQQRYMLIREVVDPAKWEAQQIGSGTHRWLHRYDYAKEPFRVVMKEFWPLHHLSRVTEHFIPTLLHENDGLILQVRLLDPCCC
jgi:hypothetical protein